jgi:putative DNA primase/helicase
VFDSSHTTNEASIIQDVSGKLFYQCFHNSCKGRTWTEARELISGKDSLKQFMTGNKDQNTTAAISTAETESAKSSRIKIIAANDFMSLELPPRENIIAPWLPCQGLAMIYAPRGVGKTYVALSLGYAASSGSSLFNWKAEKPRGVLYIDGEMPASVLQERLAKISVSNNLEPVTPLRFYTPDLQETPHIINLACEEDQKALQGHLEGIELIIIDTISTLCRAGRENEGESWLPIQTWALQQRAARRSVLFIHHAGKNGEQRGTSRREDVLDTVISLKHPGDYTPDKGACFDVHFEKSRGIYGDETKPFEAQLTTSPDDKLIWLTKPLEESTVEKVANLLNDGVQQQDIAEMLKLTKGAVSKAKKKALERGLFSKQ